MIRLRDITDPDLREKITRLLAEQRGCSAASLPDWFELDNADYSELLLELNPRVEDEDDPRM